MPCTTSRWPAAALAVIAAVTVAIIGATALPAAAQTAGFGDVPQTAYYAAPVADLDAKGVFNGTLCEDGFCPWVPIDRKTMAVWIVRVLDGQDPPPITRSRFNDVDPASFHARFIERMAELEVTSGCGDGSGFCPDRTVSRREMAAFFSRAYDLPPGPDPDFSDVPGDAWYAADVAKLAASGITVGCGGGMFCPSGATTRGQMATFLFRASSPGGSDAVVEVDLGLVSVANSFIDLSNLELPVFYCGPRESAYTSAQLSQIVNWFNRDVRAFYERQSGYAVVGNERYGATITFTSGGNLYPNYSDWSKLTIGSLRSEASFDKCTQAGMDELGHRRFVILADVPPILNGTSAFAYLERINGTLGSAVIPTLEQWKGKNYSDTEYAGTVAHEIGHGFYLWGHPWETYELDFDPYDLNNQALYRYELRSLMSWPQFNSNQDISRSGGAYVSCRQRAAKGWVQLTGRDDCEIRARPPERPLLDPLIPGDRLLITSWQPPPSSGSDEILDYDVRYRREGGDWIDWRPGNVSSSTTTTITGLTNDTLYQVQVNATNQVGTSEWSYALSASPRQDQTTGPGPGPVTLTVGDSAQGAQGADGVCTSVNCRWLHIEVSVPGEYTLACAHNGVDAIGASRGVYRSVTVSEWPSTRDCLFGYAGSEVFVIVDAERRGESWYAGEYSNVLQWEGSVAVVPDQPSVQATVNGTTVEANWSADDNGSRIDKWEIRGVGEVSATTTSYAWSNQAPGPYAVRVRAYNAHGWSAWGTSNTVTVNGNVPTLTVRRGGPGVAGSCTSTSGCEWVHGSGSGWTPGAQFWVKCGNFVDTSRNIPVAYADRYVDSNGNLTWGDRICLSNSQHNVEVWTNSDGPVRAVVPAPTTSVAEVPDQLTVRATVSRTTVAARWSADDNGSRIDKWEIGGVGEVSATTTSYVWSNQAPSAYAVRVRAHNAEGWSEWATSNTVTVTSQTVPPDAPSVRATVSGTTVRASWSTDDNGSRIDKWEIRGVGEVSATTTSYAWANQAPGPYAVRVRAHNAHGWSAWGTSNTATVNGNVPTLTVRRGGPGVAGSCTSTSGCEWVHGSGSGWTPGAQFWVKCGNFVDTSRNIPVAYADRYVDSNGNLTWGDRICLSNSQHNVEVWTNSDGPVRAVVPAPGG